MHTLSTATNAVLRGSVAASKSELTASVARVLGFDRTGNDLDRAISDQIDWMIAEIADIITYWPHKTGSFVTLKELS